MYEDGRSLISILSTQTYLDPKGGFLTPSYSLVSNPIKGISMNVPLNITMIITFYVSYSDKINANISNLLKLILFIFLLHISIGYFYALSIVSIRPEQVIMQRLHYFPDTEILSKIKVFFEIYIMKFEPFLVGFYLWVLLEKTPEKERDTK